MPRRRLFRVLALAPVVGAIVAVPAIAASSAPNKASINTLGGVKVKINQYIQDESRFSKDTVLIKSGGTLTISDKSGEPHTFSLVAKKDLPKTAGQVNNCKVCNTIGAEHQLDANGNPTVLSFNAGNPGYDTKGDSEVILPKKHVRVKVTAKKGTTLYFMCAIHPWMQGQIKVG